MTRQEVVALMESSKTRRDWKANEEKVKAAHNGQFPEFWFEAIYSSGLHNRKCDEFGEVYVEAVTVTLPLLPRG